eukprot:scaffold49996_cov15-Tisochrysis_lutea.AAC.1
MLQVEIVVDELCAATQAWAAASHFHWGLWGLAQCNTSSIEFDYVLYAKQRLQQPVTKALHGAIQALHGATQGLHGAIQVANAPNGAIRVAKALHGAIQAHHGATQGLHGAMQVTKPVLDLDLE